MKNDHITEIISNVQKGITNPQYLDNLKRIPKQINKILKIVDEQKINGYLALLIVKNTITISEIEQNTQK